MKAIPCPISVEELRHLTHTVKLTDDQIAIRIPGGTAKRVRSWRHRFGIETLPRWARNDVSPIGGQLQSLLVGSMLGYGRLVRHVNASYYSESHCGAQQPYLEWKAAIWGSWVKDGLTTVPDKRCFTQVRLTTCAHECLNEWQAMFYTSPGKGWKRLIPKIVDLVDPFALAIWYLDDGHVGWWPAITFGADATSRQVAFAIFEKFNLKPRWQLRVRNTGCFQLEREDTAHRFLELIQPHIPDCMAYKRGPFGFQGPHFQVRLKATEDVLRRLTAQNTPIRVMAERLGVGSATIDRRLVEYGVYHPRKIGRPRGYSMPTTS